MPIGILSFIYIHKQRHRLISVTVLIKIFPYQLHTNLENDNKKNPATIKLQPDYIIISIVRCCSIKVYSIPCSCKRCLIDNNSAIYPQNVTEKFPL